METLGEGKRGELWDSGRTFPFRALGYLILTYGLYIDGTQLKFLFPAPKEQENLYSLFLYTSLALDLALCTD